MLKISVLVRTKREMNSSDQQKTSIIGILNS